MLGKHWRGFGSSVVAGVMLSAILPYNASAVNSVVGYDKSIVRGTEVCGISVRGLEYTDAVELERSGFKLGKDYTYDGSRKMYVPTRQEVREGLGNMMLMLQINGVDVNQLVDDRLKYSIVRADMKDVLGHAFVWQDEPEIYLYGKYLDYWEGAETEATIVHEFGHYVESKYVSNLDRRIAYAKLRGLPTEMVYETQDGAEWGDLFEEIFAEDYKSLFVDGSLYKANQKPLSVAKRDKLRDMIVGWMVEDMDPSRDISKALSDLRYSGIVTDSDLLMCDDQAEKYLDESVSGSELVNWLVEMYYSKDTRLGDMLTRRDIDREIHKRFGFYPSDVDELSNSRYKKIVGYFNGEVDQYVKGRFERRTVILSSRVKSDLGKRYGSYTSNVLSDAVIFKMMDGSAVKSYKNGKVTRGELAHWIVSSRGVSRVSYAEARRILKGYKDVDVTSRYGRDVATVIKNKWMYGVKLGSFGYKNVVSKEQSAFLMGNVYGNVKGTGKYRVYFKDAKAVSKRYKKNVDRLRSVGVLRSDSVGKFNPKSDLTRTQWLGMLTRIERLDRGSNLRAMYRDEGMLSIYGVQDKLRRGSVSSLKISKRDVINWMK